jgi:hypothetical protein
VRLFENHDFAIVWKIASFTRKGSGLLSYGINLHTNYYRFKFFFHWSISNVSVDCEFLPMLMCCWVFWEVDNNYVFNIIRGVMHVSHNVTTELEV